MDEDNASPATASSSATIDRFSGFADLYDRYRPDPPAVLAEILTRLANTPRPEHVVDLGCGTGRSTRYWTGLAQRITGIDPTPDMLRAARELTSDSAITYLEGFSHSTGLPDGCARIITCFQSLHWMDPSATFAEARRILGPGGVFAACDYDWPPTTGSWQADQAFDDCLRRARALGREVESVREAKQWDKAGHLGRMQASGCFRFTKEIAVHHMEMGSAERLVGLALSQGALMSLIKAGVSEAELGLDALRETAQRVLGEAPHSWYWTARVRLGIV